MFKSETEAQLKCNAIAARIPHILNHSVANWALKRRKTIECIVDADETGITSDVSRRIGMH